MLKLHLILSGLVPKIRILNLLAGWLACWLAGLLASWLAGWLAGLLAGWLTGLLAGWLSGLLAGLLGWLAWLSCWLNVSPHTSIPVKTLPWI
jgi:ABC-type uncharacterized transport system permease subunit